MSDRITLTMLQDGSAILNDDTGVLMWSSDGDDTFLEEFDLPLDPDEADAILEYLEDEGYIEPDDVVDVEVEDDEPDSVSRYN